MDDEKAIRALITAWAAAIHAGDLEATVAQHSADIVVFDVPPPEAGLRGIADYRKVWPPFFEWQKSGASFEIVELHVTAGERVAFAWALLRCGTEEELEETPDRRLRLTLGLEKVSGKWSIAHEHHSFTIAP